MANLAINGGTPVRTESYPSWPTFDDNDLKTFEEIYRSGVWGTNGSKVPEFEERFAQFQGAKYGICVNSGTTALYVALKAAGVGLGDEVITTPYTFQATVVSILMANGTPVFVDTLPDGFNIDPFKNRSGDHTKDPSCPAGSYCGLSCGYGWDFRGYRAEQPRCG